MVADQIRGEDDMQRLLDCFHYNPVKHGWVKHFVDWPHSTFHEYIKYGMVISGWVGHEDERNAFGER